MATTEGWAAMVADAEGVAADPDPAVVPEHPASRATAAATATMAAERDDLTLAG